MSTKSITLRFSAELISAIDAQVRSTGSNRNEVVVNALQQAFQQAEEIDLLTDDDDDLSNRLDLLAQQVADLEERLDEDVLESLIKRITILEKIVDSQKDPIDPVPAIAASQSKSQKKNPPAAERSRQGKTLTTTSTKSTQTKTKPESKSSAKTAKTVSNSTPTPAKIDEWLSVKEAFTWLGGNPNQSNSTVSSRDGSRSITFNRFRVLNASDYKLFGLEFKQDRRQRKLPCLRPMG